MKPIYFICFILTLSCKAQTVVDISAFNDGSNNNKYFKDMTNLHSNFTGTWEYVNGNQTFRLVLYKTENSPVGFPTRYTMDVINGSYKVIVNAGTPNETILYNSVKYYPQSGQTSTSIINARTEDGVNLVGQVDDTCGNGGTEIVRGSIQMHITSPSHATLTVKKGAKIAGQNFTIPNNVTLVKIN